MEAILEGFVDDLLEYYDDLESKTTKQHFSNNDNGVEPFNAEELKRRAIRLLLHKHDDVPDVVLYLAALFYKNFDEAIELYDETRWYGEQTAPHYAQDGLMALFYKLPPRYKKQTMLLMALARMYSKTLDKVLEKCCLLNPDDITANPATGKNGMSRDDLFALQQGQQTVEAGDQRRASQAQVKSGDQRRASQAQVKPGEVDRTMTFIEEQLENYYHVSVSLLYYYAAQFEIDLKVTTKRADGEQEDASDGENDGFAMGTGQIASKDDSDDEDDEEFEEEYSEEELWKPIAKVRQIRALIEARRVHILARFAKIHIDVGKRRFIDLADRAADVVDKFRILSLITKQHICVCCTKQKVHDFEQLCSEMAFTVERRPPHLPNDFQQTLTTGVALFDSVLQPHPTAFIDWRYKNTYLIPSDGLYEFQRRLDDSDKISYSMNFHEPLFTSACYSAMQYLNNSEVLLIPRLTSSNQLTAIAWVCHCRSIQVIVVVYGCNNLPSNTMQRINRFCRLTSVTDSIKIRLVREDFLTCSGPNFITKEVHAPTKIDKLKTTWKHLIFLTEEQEYRVRMHAKASLLLAPSSESAFLAGGVHAIALAQESPSELWRATVSSPNADFVQTLARNAKNLIMQLMGSKSQLIVPSMQVVVYSARSMLTADTVHVCYEARKELNAKWRKQFRANIAAGRRVRTKLSCLIETASVPLSPAEIVAVHFNSGANATPAAGPVHTASRAKEAVPTPLGSKQASSLERRFDSAASAKLNDAAQRLGGGASARTKYRDVGVHFLASVSGYSGFLCTLVKRQTANVADEEPAAKQEASKGKGKEGKKKKAAKGKAKQDDKPDDDGDDHDDVATAVEAKMALSGERLMNEVSGNDIDLHHNEQTTNANEEGPENGKDDNEQDKDGKTKKKATKKKKKTKKKT